MGSFLRLLGMKNNENENPISKLSILLCFLLVFATTLHARVIESLTVIGMQSGMQDWILGIVLSRPNKHAAPGSTGGSSRRRGTSHVAVAQKDSRITDYINVRGLYDVISQINTSP